ncbi:MAG TPA: NAD(FAD)-dependent dehydrogenase [bacterium]|nr:NAD(FAD)-dependent dehydrogenase [bacterium]
MADKDTKVADKTTIILHGGDYDKVYSALIIGNGSLGMGMDAVIFFTFWGLQRLVKGGLEKGALSKMNMLGLGKTMIKYKMKKQNVAKLERMMRDFKELGGKILACEMTMSIMGITKKDLRQELIDGYVGVGAYVQEARKSSINLFI